MAQVPNPLPPHRELRTAIYVYAALIVLGVVLVIVLTPWIATWEPVASARASDNFLTLIVFSAVAVPVFMFVMVFGFSNLYFFRHPRQSEPPRDGPYMVAGLGPQLAWIGLTAAHALVLFVWGLIFLARADAAPAPGANQLNVDVTGEQWQFNFTYPQYNNAQSEILELPVNRPVYFTITSLDVVHSFSVDALGFKEDAVPGVFTHIRVTPSKIGSYSLRCYELCGLYHTYMEGPVRVVSAADFDTWVRGLKVHGYPWGINGAGAPVGAPTPPGGTGGPSGSVGPEGPQALILSHSPPANVPRSAFT
ncbi:MAG TPA: cytochrome c oxidase subunit II [Ktedonobacterales bacterium]